MLTLEFTHGDFQKRRREARKHYELPGQLAARPGLFATRRSMLRAGRLHRRDGRAEPVHVILLEVQPDRADHGGIQFMQG